MPTPTEDAATLPETGSAEHRKSVVQAQVEAMRASAIATAQTMHAFAMQCDSFLLMLNVVAQARRRPAPPATIGATQGMPRRTFKTREQRTAGEAGNEDGDSPPNTSELEDRVRQSGATDGG